MASEPMLISGMRRHPTGEVRHMPAKPIGMSGTTTANFLAELDGWAAAIQAEARDAGIRQAVEWLRAGYPYGTGPDWRENGAEWIAERAAEDRLGTEASR